jgi:ATP-dependent protease ClpP protease subunit
MIHPVAGGQEGKIHELKADVFEADRLNIKLFELLDKNCGQQKNYFWNLAKDKNLADWYLTAEETKIHNMANHVGLPNLSVDVKMDFKFGV